MLLNVSQDNSADEMLQKIMELRNVMIFMSQKLQSGFGDRDICSSKVDEVIDFASGNNLWAATANKI